MRPPLFRTTPPLLTALCLGGALLPAPAARAADTFYVTIVGAKQGAFQGDGHSRAHFDQIVGLKYDDTLTVPTDAATGQATGRRQHHPISFEKEWGLATPQLYQAAVTGEVLRSVTFEFYTTAADGSEVPTFRVQLTNAFIVGIHKHVGDAKAEGGLDPHRYEDISLTYQKITLSTATTSVGDDWQSLAMRLLPAVPPSLSRPRPSARVARRGPGKPNPSPEGPG